MDKAEKEKIREEVKARRQAEAAESLKEGLVGLLIVIGLAIGAMMWLNEPDDPAEVAAREAREKKQAKAQAESAKRDEEASRRVRAEFALAETAPCETTMYFKKAPMGLGWRLTSSATGESIQLELIFPLRQVGKIEKTLDRIADEQIESNVWLIDLFQEDGRCPA